MIASLVINNKYDIVPTKAGKLKIDNTDISIKEIPFIRYRFEHYGEEEIAYINKMKKVFEYSVHLAEVNLSEWCFYDLNSISMIDNMAKYLYVPIEEENITNGLSESVKEQLIKYKEYKNQTGISVDQIMLKDNTKSLYLIAAEALKKEVSVLTSTSLSSIGYCSSPLSFGGQACLTAIKARELAAKYTERDDLPLPTANHECMNKCGCIRYLIIESDIVMEDKKNTSDKNKINIKISENTEAKKSKAKANKIKTGGYFKL